jgi:hypothetical protein
MPLSVTPLPATTTHQQDLTVEGQRRINLIWERTQAVIAIVVVFSTMAATLWQVFTGSSAQTPTVLTGAFFGVLGSYFARTNHEKVGGVGPKVGSPYEGR